MLLKDEPIYYLTNYYMVINYYSISVSLCALVLLTVIENMKNGNDNVRKEVENILTKVAQSQNIKSFEIFLNDNQTQGDGFLSEFFTGEVLNKDNGKTIKVAIKKAPADGFSVDIGNEVIYKNEVHFYSKVFPVLDKFQKEKNVKHPFEQIPRYLVGNGESTNIFIAMENLKTAGYALFDKKKYLDSQHLKFIFKTYGKLHALSFSFKQKNKEKYQNLVSIFTNIIDTLVEPGKNLSIIEKTFSSALESFDPITEADILAKLRTIENVAETFNKIKTYKGHYKCLVHGDCWSNNMLFKYKKSGELEDIKLIDFQLAGSSNPIYDLSYFFYSGASKTDMDKLDDYLDLYYESFSNFARELEENPEDIFPLNVLKEEWKMYGIYGIYLGCELWFIKLMDRGEIEKVLVQKGLPADKYWDLLKEQMGIIVKTPEFKERTKNICLHAVEYGIL